MRRPILSNPGLLLSIAIFFIAVPILVYFVASGSGDGTSKDVIPKSMVGTWYQTNKMKSGITMQASVSLGGTIQIDMKAGDSSNIYWMGSFEYDEDPQTDFNTLSQADSDAQKVMAGSLFGSQDSKKSFTYKNGELSYEFTMMGVDKTIHLEQH